ncbi:MAG: helix-turn-helix domain-containing protein [Acidobacteria bacterium]|nr:helix-turn-helix domain-containing protein [Acidobacteriota bacterium]
MTAPAVQPDENQLPVPVQMLQIITSFWTSRAVGVFAKLGISDVLQSGPKTAEELAEATGTHAPSLFRLLRALASAGIVKNESEDRFGLTPLSETLVTNAPDRCVGSSFPNSARNTIRLGVI